MTGSHEVRGSIPLGSTIIFNKLGAVHWLPLTYWCANISVRSRNLRTQSFSVPSIYPFVDLSKLLL